MFFLNAPATTEIYTPSLLDVLPFSDRATEAPCSACPTESFPVSFCCCVHSPLLRVNTQAAPTLLLSCHPPMMLVLPSADRLTEMPWDAPPTESLAVNFCCCVHTPLL